VKSSEISYYGVIERSKVESDIDLVVEDVTRLGFAVISAGLSKSEIIALGDCFDRMHAEYVAHYGLEYLQMRDEHNTIRLPLALEKSFLDLARRPHLLAVIDRLITGKFILNQQNGIVNPVNSRYNQDAWHRDLPYQHFVCSRPIAINALYCIDDFTEMNGATSVLPASHQQEVFPSDEFISKHAKQIIAPAGSFIIIDCMTYHRGGRNYSAFPRRAVNHVFTIPYIKQQLSIPSVMKTKELDDAACDLLGYRYLTPGSIDEFLDGIC
jgi:Phytanoyl-CoA dioxygenase (PhyH)